jgi:hypothetical protein
MAGPGGSSSNNTGTAHTKRRRHSSSPDVRDAVNQANGTFSNARTQLPVLDPSLAPAAFYHDVRRGAPKDSRTFEVSDVRLPYMASNAGQHPMQGPIDTMGSVPSQSGQPLFTTYKDISDAYTLPRISDTTQASSSKTKDTPSSIQAISAGLMSAPTTMSTPRSESGQSGLPGVMPLDYGTRNALYGGLEGTRTVSWVVIHGHAAFSASYGPDSPSRLPMSADMTVGTHSGDLKSEYADLGFHVAFQMSVIRIPLDNHHSIIIAQHPLRLPREM